LNNVFNSSMTGSTNITFDLVNEIVNSLLESAQKPTAHFVSRVNKKTFEEWTVKFPWLIVIKIKEQSTLSCKMCQKQSNTF